MLQSCVVGSQHTVRSRSTYIYLWVQVVSREEWDEEEGNSVCLPGTFFSTVGFNLPSVAAL